MKKHLYKILSLAVLLVAFMCISTQAFATTTIKTALDGNGDVRYYVNGVVYRTYSGYGNSFDGKTSFYFYFDEG